LWDHWFWVVVRTSSNKVTKNIFPFIDGRFNALSEHFIDIFYPHRIKISNQRSSSFILNAIAYTDSVILSSVRPPNLVQFKKRISSDIQKLHEGKYHPVSLIYLLDDSISLSREEIDDLNNKLSTNGFRVIIYDENMINESLLLSYRHPLHSKTDSLNSQYNYFFNVPQIENSVLDEIFNFVNTDAKNKVEIIPFEKRLLSLKLKIQANFINKNYPEVKSLFSAYWSNKEFVEYFIKQNFHRYEHQLYAILIKIRNHFINAPTNNERVVNFPVNDPAYFEELAKLLIPTGKESDPRFLITANALILFFFEYCDFGQKTPEDPATLFTKFDESE